MAFRYITQYSPLKWYPNDSLTYGERQGKDWRAVYLDPCPINQIFPFQLAREQTGNQISYFRVTNVITGVVTDITTEIKAAGLRVDQYPVEGYDLITYPATVKILGVAFDNGVYQCTMSDGANAWRSECFNMLTDQQLERFVKITWCNNDPIEYDGGAINYSNGFKHWIYLDTNIRRPTFPSLIRGATRQTVNFNNQVMAYKQYSFLLSVPEYVLDTIHFIRGHHEILIEHEGVCYDAMDFDMDGEPEWDNNVGDIGTVEVRFRTNTLAINTHADGTDCDVPDECVDIDFSAKDILVNNGTLYNAFQYRDADNNVQSLQDGDYIIRSDTGILGDPLTLYLYNASSYTGTLLLPNIVVKDESTGIYYYADGLELVRPAITSYVSGTNTVTGNSLPTGTVVEIWGRASGIDSLLAVTDNPSLMAGVVLPTLPTGTDFLFLKIGSPICGNFFDSALFPVVITGCTLDLHGVYATTAAAVTAGIAAGQEWESDNSFTMGTPEGTVFEYQSANVYNTYGDAIAGGLQDGDCYVLAISNPFGLPQDLLCVVNPTTTYADDAAAGVGGIAIGAEYYLSAINTYGLGFGMIPGIVKIRKT